MRVITRRRLSHFWAMPNRHDAEEPLKAWFADAEKALWQTPNEIKDTYRNASIIGNSRVVFNIAGNKYRLVVAVDYHTGFVLIKFIETHKDYDAMDAETYEGQRNPASVNSRTC